MALPPPRRGYAHGLEGFQKSVRPAVHDLLHTPLAAQQASKQLSNLESRASSSSASFARASNVTSLGSRDVLFRDPRLLLDVRSRNATAKLPFYRYILFQRPYIYLLT